jgi:hypothetical protein
LRGVSAGGGDDGASASVAGWLVAIPDTGAAAVSGTDTGGGRGKGK